MESEASMAGTVSASMVGAEYGQCGMAWGVVTAGGVVLGVGTVWERYAVHTSSTGEDAGSEGGCEDGCCS